MFALALDVPPLPLWSTPVLAYRREAVTRSDQLWRHLNVGMGYEAGNALTTAFYVSSRGEDWLDGFQPRTGLGKRLLASNRAVNVRHRGFVACYRYANGEQAMAAITCPVLFVLGAQDQMTQSRAAQTLLSQAQSAGKSVQLVTLPVGHHQMTETPDATLFAIRDFLKTA